MPKEDFDAVLARLDERSKSMQEAMEHLVEDIKETKKWLAKLTTQQEKIGILEVDLKSLREELRCATERLKETQKKDADQLALDIKANAGWIEAQKAEQIKRKNDLAYDVIKLVVSAVLGSTLTALGLHFINGL